MSREAREAYDTTFNPSIAALYVLDESVCDIGGKLDEYVKCVNAKCSSCKG